MSGFGLENEDKNNRIFIIAKELVLETNFFKRLQGVDVLIEMLDDDLKVKCDYLDYRKDVKEYVEDDLFVRQAKLLSVIVDNVETAIEYYGKDYLNGDDFLYREDFEEKRKRVDNSINKFLGVVLREVSVTEELII